jgi:outer membrane receptor for ferrienterochelin and colicins
MNAKHKTLFALMLVIANIIRAQDAPVMVVTGAKVAEDVRDAVTAVEVVTREEIEAMGAKNVAEVMENIPGVVIFDHPQATVMMQGFEGAYVKVLVDGVEVTGDTGGATPVNMISVSDIERIEIVRGASSVLYGSDAMGGVINIITKKPEKDKFSFQTRHEFSSNIRYFGEAFAGYDSAYFAASLGGSFDWDGGKIVQERNGMGKMIDIYDVAYSRLAGLRGSAVWHHPGGDLEAFGSWGDTLLKTSADLENGYDFAYAKAEGGVKGSYKFSDTALLDGVFSYHRLDYDATKYNYTFNTNTPYAESLFQDIEGELRFAWEPLISHAFLFGINTKREALESDSFYGEKSQTMLAVFAQDTWNIKGLDRFRIVPGVRMDWRLPNDADEDHIVKVTPKLAFRYDPFEKLVLRFSYGMGFKTPSLKQNYWVFFHPAPYNFLLTGNPNLKPETSHGFNLSADYAVTGELSVTAAAYFNYIVDLIDDYISGEDPGSAQNAAGNMQNYIYTRSYRNVGKAITTGGDISIRFNVKRVKLLIAYSLVIAKGVDEETGEYNDLSGRVPHQVTLSAAYTIPVIETIASLRATWNAPQLAGSGMDGSSEGHTPDYLMVNLRVAKFLFSDKLEVYGGVQNLLNNIHFVKGSAGQTQRDYFGLRDGIIFTLGAAFKL